MGEARTGRVAQRKVLAARQLVGDDGGRRRGGQTRGVGVGVGLSWVVTTAVWWAWAVSCNK